MRRPVKCSTVRTIVSRYDSDTSTSTPSISNTRTWRSTIYLPAPSEMYEPGRACRPLHARSRGSRSYGRELIRLVRVTHRVHARRGSRPETGQNSPGSHNMECPVLRVPHTAARAPPALPSHNFGCTLDLA